MMLLGLVRQYWPHALAVIGLAYALTTAYGAGHRRADEAWQAKWSQHLADDAKATARHEAQLRELEQARQTAINEVTADAQAKIDQAAADAAVAAATAHSLRDEADRISAELADSEAGRSACATAASKAAAHRARMLADVFKRADERAGELAAAADQARARGLACEAAYDALAQEAGQ